MKYEISFTARQEVRTAFDGFVIIEADSPYEAYKKVQTAVDNGQTLIWRSKTPGKSSVSPITVHGIAEAVPVEDTRPTMRPTDSYRVFRCRLDHFYKEHPDQCPHSMTQYGPVDESSQWIDMCCTCNKVITESDRRKFIE